jgi:integrase
MGQKLTVQDDYYIFMVKSVYYVKFRDPETRELLSKKSTGMRSRPLAKQWASEEWERRCSMAGLRDTPLGDYAKHFFTGEASDPYQIRIQAAGRHLTYKARRVYRADLVKYVLTDKICLKSIPLIKRSDSIDFRDRLIAQFSFTRKSKRIFQAYKNVIHTALEKGLTNIDSVLRVDVAYKKQKRAATSIENIIKLFDSKNWKNQKIRAATIATGMLGLRAGETRGIIWRDFDRETNKVYIDRNYVDVEKEKLPKWGKTRVSVYPPILQELLEPLRGSPGERVFSVTKDKTISYTALRNAFNKAVEKAGIPKITLHGLRHSIQTALLNKGVNRELLRATFGWENENVQEIYTHRELYNLDPQREATEILFQTLMKGEDGNG